MRSGISSRLGYLPKVCGKGCAHAVGLLWAGCVWFSGLTHTPRVVYLSLWKTKDLYTVLYTKITQLGCAIVHISTPVVGHFYTLSTRPTNITTTLYIGEKI